MQVKFDYGVFQIYVHMALFLLENRDFLGFRIIIKVPLNHFFLIFYTFLCAIT